MIQHATCHDFTPNMGQPPRCPTARGQFRRLVGALSIVFIALVSMTACGTACPTIRKDFETFDAALDTTPVVRGASKAARGPDGRLDLPLPLVNRLIADTVRARAPRRVPLPPLSLPGAAPVQLPGLFWSLSKVELIALPNHRTGARLTLALSDHDANLVDFLVESHVQPFFAGGPLTRITRASWVLRPSDISRIEPFVTPEGRTRLGTWLRELLPTTLRFLAEREIVDALLPLLLDLLTNTVWPNVRDKVLGQEPLIDVGIDLPDWPIRGLKLETATPAGPEPGKISLLLTSAFDLDAAVGQSPKRSGGDDRATLTLTGALGARLMALGMRDGRLPGRFTKKGEPANDGVWHARPVWLGGKRPFGAHLWRFDDSCRRVTLDAELVLALEGEEIRVMIREARLDEVKGSGLVEAFAWTERVFGDALDLTLRQPASIDIDLDPGQARLKIAAIRAEQHNITLDFEIVAHTRQ